MDPSCLGSVVQAAAAVGSGSVLAWGIVTRSQSYWIPLRCSEKGDLNPRCTANQIRIAGCHNKSIDPNFKRVLLKHCRVHDKKNWSKIFGT